MDEQLLKTSFRQRLWIIVIAILLLGSTIATYAAIVISANKSGSTDTSALEEAYAAKQSELNEYATVLSDDYYDTFASFRSEVKAYNAESANSTGVKTTDLKDGDGRELTEGDLEYFAYYIGWCADESVFDSSFDDWDNPTSLKAPLYAGQGLIEGWNTGVIGMKIGGVREIQIPAELAYGEDREICGGTNSPLKFIVMPVTDETLTSLNNDLDDLYAQLINAYYSSYSY